MEALEEHKSINIRDFKPPPKGYIKLNNQRLSFELASYGRTKDRPFFICPECKQRREKLYLKNSLYACQKCHNLTYRSSLTSPKRRQIEKAKKVRQGLGDDNNIFKPFPDKPPTMRWKKYFKLKLQDRETKHNCARLLLRGEA